MALVLCMAACPTAAFDLKIGRLDFGPSPADTLGPRRAGGAAVGATISIPFGDSGSSKSTATLNGMDMTRFTQQNAKDAFISTMLIGVFIAAGVLSVGALASSVSSE